MKTKAAFFLSCTIAAVWLLCACSGGGYRLQVEDPGGYLLETPPQIIASGDTVVVKTVILHDADLEAFVNGKSIGKQTAVKTDGKYTHWEFSFLMPESDATLTFRVANESNG